MNEKEYIESGILELYVAGSLSEKENQEVYQTILQYSEILQEVLKIEASIVKLTTATSPTDSKFLFNSVKEKLGLLDDTSKIIPIDKSKSNWLTYIGWAASVLLASGLILTIIQNNNLKTQVKVAETEKQQLEQQIEDANANLADAKQLVTVLRDKDIIGIPLDGQAISPDAYAKVYWNKKTKNIYLDAQGLPEPPEGKVYQVWSLTLNPLTPTSLGIIDTFSTDENKIFMIENSNKSEAFAITLEPAGGSTSPTLEQLYTIGTVASTS